MTTKRDKILETTSELLQCHGYHAIGLAQILGMSGAQKGTLYHHFPGGKEELMAEAVNQVSQLSAQKIQSFLDVHEDAAEALYHSILRLVEKLEATQFQFAPPLAQVALDTAEAESAVNKACQAAYENRRRLYQQKLLANGFTEARAERLASLIVSTIEGAMIQARTAHSAQPLLDAAEELRIFIKVAQLQQG